MIALTPKPGDTIVVWFSNGAASAVAAHETIRRYGAMCDVRVVNNPVVEEDEDNLRFGRDVETWLGQPIVAHFNPKFPHGSAVDTWEQRGAMVFPHGAPCTVHLKKEARQDYERQHRVDWHVLGFTADEVDRHDRFILTERSNVLPVLIEAEMTKDDCAALLLLHGLALPRVYAEGYQNANCIGCVKATSPTYWNLVRRTRPAVFQARAEQSRRLGVRLVRYKGERIFLDELPEDAVGRPLKTMTIECGIFCEEKPPVENNVEFNEKSLSTKVSKSISVDAFQTETYPARNKGKTMINLTIEAASSQEFIDTIRRIASALSSDTVIAAAPAVVETTAAPAETKTTTTRKKKDTPVADTTASGEGTTAAETDSADQNVETIEETASDEPTTEPETPAVKLTLDNVRKFAIKYVNDAESDQEARKTRFQAILKQFGGVAKFQDIAEAKWPEVIAWINEQRVSAGLSAGTVEA